MGMFDTIVCDFKLPFKGANDFRYQTKDLENCLDNYYIDTDGQLWRFDGGAEKSKYSFNGNLNFYAFEPNREIRWLEFQAVFKNGVTKKIKKIRND